MRFKSGLCSKASSIKMTLCGEMLERLSPVQKNILFSINHTFYRPIRKTKVLNDSFNEFAYNFYLQSILIFERIFTKMMKCKPNKMPLNIFQSTL